MAVTAGAIKELRELTGSGMLDCKKALEETGGDVKEAIEYLRKKGLATAAKKAGRIAAEGVCWVCVSQDGKKGVIVEVNCETDFVAINDDFKVYVKQIAEQLLTSPAQDVAAFLAEPWALNKAETVQEVLTNKIATIGENLSIRRFERYATDGALSSYIHGGGKISVMVDVVTTAGGALVDELGRNLCMQIVGLQTPPKYVGLTDIPPELVAKEKEIIAAALAADPEAGKKPEQVRQKMAEGRLNKQLKEMCLIEQPYVKDGDMTVAAYIASVAKEAGAAIEVKRFVCFEKGEGIEKKQDDFAAEVEKMMA